MRPHGEICAVVVNPPACACVDSETGDPTSIKPIDQCNGYIAISPAYYSQLEDWIQQLITKVRGFPKVTSALTYTLNEAHKIVELAKAQAR
jgi:hypothetical protein